jgi:hypothetical protein
MTNCSELSTPVPHAFVAEVTALVTPCVVGVPVIAPVDEFKLSPAGNGVAAKLDGDCVAVSVNDNDVPTVPAVVVVLVIVGLRHGAVIVKTTVL